MTLKCLVTQDVIVVKGGTNDIDSKRNQTHRVLAHMTQFIQENVHSNIIIVNIPPRHDQSINQSIHLRSSDPGGVRPSGY
jgi:lysophospholipase L1-like esterase